MINELANADIAMLSGGLTSGAILVGMGKKAISVSLPNGFELKGKANELLNKTGQRVGNEISRTVLRKKIAQADLDIKPEYFLGFQYAMPVLAVLLTIPPALMGLLDFYWGVLLAILLYITPGMWLNKKVKERVELIKRDIPDFCMLFGNALKGADILTALEEVSRTLKGELSTEINKALVDMATGDNRMVALNKMAMRISIPELTGLVNKMQQAMRYGSPLDTVVKHHAEKILMRRKQDTQKVAGELTIKLLFPIVLFVLLPLFMLLGFPIMWNLLNIFG